MTRIRLRPGAQARPNRDRRAASPRFAAGLAILGLILVGGVSTAAAADKPRLLVLPVVVHSAEAPEYVRDGLADMLAARFARIGSLELVRPQSGGQGTTDHDRALALGRKAGADYVLFGSFTRFGQGASLDVQCAPVSEDKNRKPLREIFVHSGSIGEIIPDLDELAGKVSRYARGEVPGTPTPTGASVDNPDAAAAVGDASLADLTSRVEALEAALTELLEDGMSVAADGGTDAELR